VKKAALVFLLLSYLGIGWSLYWLIDCICTGNLVGVICFAVLAGANAINVLTWERIYRALR